VIDDDDDDLNGDENEETKTPRKTPKESTNDRRTTAMQSEATSSHAIRGDLDDGSVKSLNKQEVKPISP